ncbi:unnamed protein product [Pseudo-nitzschia multistriata]|uniref:Uncharacterized protein n=1 Tax=Pseudo-nitzschia multistriata TaxID=183589 RepID=A0A448YXF5_9STRA|nr:unnamed protein product [Pseudo-nitzschia multistriata]
MRSARTLYHPLNHIWLRAAKHVPTKNGSTGLPRQQSHRFLEMGLTERGMEDIGDITSVRWSDRISRDHRRCDAEKSVVTADVQRGDELMHIHFDGHAITSADELYHTVWETFSDRLSIASPLSGTIRRNGSHGDDTEGLESLETDGIDDDTVLLEITATEEEWNRASRENGFVTESEYLEITEREPRGAFH